MKNFIERGGLVVGYILGGFAALVVLALVWVAGANAQTPCPSGPVASNAALLCWTNATQYTDGSPIPAEGPGALKSTQVRNGKCAATAPPSTVSIISDVAATMGSALYGDLELGWQCFSVRHETNAGVFSNWSPWLRKELTAPPPPADKPKPPAQTIR